MNNLFNKTITILCKVFFNATNEVEKLPEFSKELAGNEVEKLPEFSKELAGKIVLKIHPKGFKMQIRKYKSDGYPEYDIDLHDHNEKEKEYTNGGIHIHEFEWKFIKKLKRNKYIRLGGRNLTDEEYEFLQNINYKDLIQIQVRYI